MVMCVHPPKYFLWVYLLLAVQEVTSLCARLRQQAEGTRLQLWPWLVLACGAHHLAMRPHSRGGLRRIFDPG